MIFKKSNETFLFKKCLAPFPDHSANWKKKKKTLKVESYVLFSGLSEHLKPRRQNSQLTLIDSPKDARQGARICWSFCSKD